MANPSNKILREFIMTFFSDEELVEFCFDYFPEVKNNFARGMDKSDKVMRLIEYCRNRELMQNLLGNLQVVRPTPYQESFSSQNDVSTPVVSTPVEAMQPVTRNPQQIFISHSGENSKLAHQLAKDLKQDGYSIWIAPESIQPGEKWVTAINRGLEESGIFMLLLTPHAISSKWVNEEMNAAIALAMENQMRILLLDVQESRPPILWRTRQFLPFRDEYTDGLILLRQTLNKMFDKRPEPTTATPPPPSEAELIPPPSTEPATVPMSHKADEEETRPAAQPTQQADADDDTDAGTADILQELRQLKESADQYIREGLYGKAAEIYESMQSWSYAAELWQLIDQADKAAAALAQHAQIVSKRDVREEEKVAAWQHAAQAYVTASQPVEAARIWHEQLGDAELAAELYLASGEFALAAELNQGWAHVEQILTILQTFNDEHGSVYLFPDIPFEKLHNSIEACQLSEDDRVLALSDLTIFGSAKKCLLFTVDTFHYNSDNGSGAIPYSEFPQRIFADLRSFNVSLGEDPATGQIQQTSILGSSAAWTQLLQTIQALFAPAQPQDSPAKDTKTDRGKEPAPVSQLDLDGETFVHEKTGLEFIRIPAGEFLYGDEKEPVHLETYWISKTPVTNKVYKLFIDANPEQRLPRAFLGMNNWNKKDRSYPDGTAEHPVIQVSWDDVVAFCHWAGASLPTQQQWEKAARGTDGRIYPWGNTWEDGRCNTKEAGIGIVSLVGQFSPAGDSPYGCVDMCGNAWEWCLYKGAEPDNSEIDDSHNLRMMRGGSWLNNANEVSVTAYREFIPGHRNSDLGFRVVLKL